MAFPAAAFLFAAPSSAFVAPYVAGTRSGAPPASMLTNAPGYAGRLQDESFSASSALSGVSAALALGAVAGAARGRKAVAQRKGDGITAMKESANDRSKQIGQLTEKQWEDYMAPYRRDLGFASGLIGGKGAYGDYNFDPAGFSERVPQAVPFFREAELKHGRICMLAFVGLVVPDIVRIPGPAPCYTANVVDAHNACVGQGVFSQEGPMLQIFLFCFVIELVSFSKFVEGLTLENAGDYRLGINFLPKDKEGQEQTRLKELKNGRLAMLGFSGAITQAVISGNGFPWLY